MAEKKTPVEEGVVTKQEPPDLTVWLPRYQNFLSTWHVRTILQKVMPTLITKYDTSIRLNLDCSGNSYTDGQNINLSLGHEFFKDRYNWKEWMMVMRALEGHECQHINSTPMHYMTDIRTWFGEYMEENHDIPKAIGQKVGGTFFNIFEDGRIEQIAATHHPGLRIPLQFMNVEMVRDAELTKDDLDGGRREYVALQNLTLCYSKLGVGIKGFEALSGTELHTQFHGIYPLLDDAVNGLTCADCFNATKQALTTLAPYIAKLLRADADLMKFLEELADHMSGSMSGESELNDGDPSEGIRMGIGSVGGKSGKGSGGKAGGESSDNSEDESDESEGAGGGKEGDGDEDGKSGSKEDGKGKSEDKGSAEKSSGDTGDGGSISATPSGRCMDKDTTSGPGKFGADPIPDLDATKLPYSEQELIDAIEKSAAGAAPHEKSKAKEPARNELSEKERKELRKAYEGDVYTTLDERYASGTPLPLPNETMAKANILHRKLVRILQQKRQEQRNQRKGILDVRALWKAGTGEKGIMMKRGKPITADCAVFELVDNSGSMAGHKFKLARLTAGALEIALHGLASLKISLFSTRYGENTTQHDTIKDFDQVGSSGKSIAFGSIENKKITAGGGNKDGFSIRVATKELLKRSEKNKVLVIISDGEPTDYRGGTIAGTADVRDAVAEAKKKGIIVIALLIGDSSYIRDFKGRHVEMYGKHLIACEPELMLSEFEKLFTKLIKAS